MFLREKNISVIVINVLFIKNKYIFINYMTRIQYTNQSSLLSSIPTRDNRNNALLSSKENPGLSLMPAKFRNADGNASFSMGRRLFINTEKANSEYNVNDLTNEFNKKKCTCIANCGHVSCECNKSCTVSNRNKQCSVGKSINVQSSDLYIQRRKNQAIGRGSGFTDQDKEKYELSYRGVTSNNVTNNIQNRELRRVRNRGYRVPPGVVAHRNSVGRPLSGDCKRI